MRPKIESYLGFARKSRSIVVGLDTCQIYGKKGKLKLIIVPTDLGKTSLERAQTISKKGNIPIVFLYDKEKMSQVLGHNNPGVIGVLDNNFAKVILEEIEKLQATEEINEREVLRK